MTHVHIHKRQHLASSMRITDLSKIENTRRVLMYKFFQKKR